MSPMQTVLIFTDQPAQHTVHILQIQDTKFSSEVFLFDPQFNTSYSFHVPINGIYDSAYEAFNAAIKWVAGWLTTKGQTAKRINNPCNCEFLSARDQQSIFKEYGIETPVEVNG